MITLMKIIPWVFLAMRAVAQDELSPAPASAKSPEVSEPLDAVCAGFGAWVNLWRLLPEELFTNLASNDGRNEMPNQQGCLPTQKNCTLSDAMPWDPPLCSNKGPWNVCEFKAVKNDMRAFWCQYCYQRFVTPEQKVENSGSNQELFNFSDSCPSRNFEPDDFRSLGLWRTYIQDITILPVSELLKKNGYEPYNDAVNPDGVCAGLLGYINYFNLLNGPASYYSREPSEMFTFKRQITFRGFENYQDFEYYIETEDFILYRETGSYDFIAIVIFEADIIITINDDNNDITIRQYDDDGGVIDTECSLAELYKATGPEVFDRGRYYFSQLWPSVLDMNYIWCQRCLPLLKDGLIPQLKRDIKKYKNNQLLFLPGFCRNNGPQPSLFFNAPSFRGPLREQAYVAEQKRELTNSMIMQMVNAVYGEPPKASGDQLLLAEEPET